MTAQIPDSFLFKGEEYCLAGLVGDELFSPDQYGMEPMTINTACWRGFYAAYEITDTGIYLRELTMREKGGNYKSINGVEPDIQDYEATYRDVNLPIPFTGTIRLAKDFIKELYIHMGFQKPTSFKIVLDLLFERGCLVEIRDRSEEIEAKRGAFKKKYEESENPIQAIEDAFSLELDIE